MMIEKRFFVWNEKDNHTAVKLGDNVDSLLKQKIIIPSDEDDDTQFKLAGNNNVWIGSNNGLVIYIYFTQFSGDHLLGLNDFELKFPSTAFVTTFLSKKYKQLHYQDTDEVKAHYDGDLLYIIFRDAFPSNVFLMRL